jgi:hypothetical protein
VLIGLVVAPAVEVGLLLPLLPQAASERASKKSRLRVLNQFLRCKKKLFIEFSSLIDFREFFREFLRTIERCLYRILRRSAA